MKFKRLVSVLIVFAMLMTGTFVCLADPTEDFHEGPLPGEDDGSAKGPTVEEYMVYKEDKIYAPGSLGTDVDLTTVGRGLFFDGTDFYFFIDTGTMATNYMYTIEGDRFFFGEDGKMVRNQLITYNDEIYFFDANGAMFKNRWYYDEQIDELDNNKLVYTRYYFGPTGRAYRAPDTGRGLVVKTIDGEKYGFNTEGECVEGYYDLNGNKIDPNEDPAYEQCMYYFEPEADGAALTGWHYYEGATRGDEYEENEEIVLYFDEKTCQKVYSRVSYGNEERCISRIIDGNRYMFDHYGVRRNSWYVSEPSRATHSNIKYFSDEYDGNLQKGWFEAVPGSRSADGSDLILGVNKRKHDEDETCWFYAGKNGSILRKTIRKIGSYVYAFDDDGVMQSDAFVKVKNGAFIKAYETDNLTRANILLDVNEYGGNADPDPDGPGDPINLDKEKGLLRVNQGEQWMFFLGDYQGDEKLGSQARPNAQVKVELDDAEIFFVQNNVGGYAYSNAAGSTETVARGGILIQNGVVLKPDKDVNNYGIVRLHPVTNTEPSTVLNYNNQRVAINIGEVYPFVVVNSQGKLIDARRKSFKDSSGNYIYVEDEGYFIGCYPFEGRYYTQPPKGVVDDDGYEIANPVPGWYYKKFGDKKWTFGLPSEDSRVDISYMALNFGPNSSYGTGNYGPYTNGIASKIYENP